MSFSRLQITEKVHKIYIADGWRILGGHDDHQLV